MKPNEHDDVEEHLPKKGWLGLWMKFTGNLEICPRFRFFSACSAVGAAVNNKVWIQRGDEGLLPKLFPNPWVMLLAPPGRGHKTTAINMAVNCLTEACDDVRILADKLTPEYLVKALSSPSTPKEMIRIGPRDATGLIKASEDLKCDDLLVITWDSEGEENHSAKRITFMPLWKWLLEKSN